MDWNAPYDLFDDATEIPADDGLPISEELLAIWETADAVDALLHS